MCLKYGQVKSLTVTTQHLHRHVDVVLWLLEILPAHVMEYIVLRPESDRIWLVFLLMVWWCAPGIMDWLLAIATDLLLSQSIQTDCGTHLSILWVSGALSLGVQWLGNETDHSSPSGAMVKLSVVVPWHPHMPLWHAQWQLYPWGAGSAYWYCD